MRQQMGISVSRIRQNFLVKIKRDFAQAYVIAHEVGHHIQNLLGISGQVQQARAQASQTQGNQLSVRFRITGGLFCWYLGASESTTHLNFRTGVILKKQWMLPRKLAMTIYNVDYRSGCSR